MVRSHSSRVTYAARPSATSSNASSPISSVAVDDHVHVVGHVAGTEVVLGLVERLVLHRQVLHRELGVDQGPADQPGQRAASRFGLGQVVLALVRLWRTDEREEPGVGGERFDVGLEDLHTVDRRDRRGVAGVVVVVVGAPSGHQRDDQDDEEGGRQAARHGA